MNHGKSTSEGVQRDVSLGNAHDPLCPNGDDVFNSVCRTTALPWVYDDGGRADAGYRGSTRDCACRSIAIVTGMGYRDIYDLLIEYARRERPSARKVRSHPRTGVHLATIRRVMADLGWTWTPTMQIGSGTTVHVRTGELPATGRYLLSLSRHVSALVDGVIHDTNDPARDGTRAVYGYWRPALGMLIPEPESVRGES